MKNRISWIAILLVVGYITTDFVTAPLTPAGKVKSFIGARIVEDEVRQQGISNAETFCKGVVFEKLGFYHTCSITRGGTSGPDGQFSTVSLAVSTFTNLDDARDAIGRTYFDVRNEEDPYYLGTTLRTYRKPIRLAFVTLETKRIE